MSLSKFAKKYLKVRIKVRKTQVPLAGVAAQPRRFPVRGALVAAPDYRIIFLRTWFIFAQIGTSGVSSSSEILAFVASDKLKRYLSFW